MYLIDAPGIMAMQVGKVIRELRDDASRQFVAYGPDGETVVETIPYDADENAAADQRAAQAAQAATAQTLTADAAADLPRLEQALADTLLLLGPNDQPGSIRHHRTTILTNQYQVAAQRAQDDLILALAVIVRRLVRQQIRDTRLQTGTLDSADVGPDAT